MVGWSSTDARQTTELKRSVVLCIFHFSQKAYHERQQEKQSPGGRELRDQDQDRVCAVHCGKNTAAKCDANRKASHARTKPAERKG